MSRRVGIDLGTTFCAVGVVDPAGRPEIVPNREGDRITPSVVLFDGDCTIVGSMARRSAVASPESTIQFVKRHIGSPDWQFEADNGVKYSAQEISAAILRRLKEDAEMMLNDTVEEAVITVPAYFTDAQRQATIDAARMAGLKVLQIINEPTAAALAYGMGRTTKEENICVYDLGGGTFDVTLLHVAPNTIRVLATGGDKNLGGFDFDNAVMNHLNTRFKAETGIDLLDDPTTAQDLRDKAEAAKKTLSQMDKTQVFLAAGGKTMRVPFTLTDFETAVEGLLRLTRDKLEEVLDDSGLTWSAIDKILLVGGSTRMRAVASLVEQVTGKKPSVELHPDEVVALGAALRAELCASEEDPAAPRPCLPPMEVRDVCSHSMGVVVQREDGSLGNAIILKKDTPIPCQVSQTFQTVRDNQLDLAVRVTEGELEELDGVVIAAEATMEIPRYPRGAPVKVSFSYDENGVIQVSVEDLTAGKLLGNVNLKRAGAMSKEDLARGKQKVGALTFA